MAAQFSHSGVSFQYPENWKVERDEIDNGWLATVQSPDTSFLMVCYREDAPASEELADEALANLRDSYPSLEVEPGSSTIARHRAQGYDVRFFLFDLTNTCWIRTFESDDATLLVMWQVTELEMESHEPVLRAICQSLRVG